MTSFLETILFILGLGIGSFLNVLTLRYNPEGSFFSRKAMSGRSRCGGCGTQLRWFELIPLFSFVIQRGRCRTCGVLLSPQYPLVEFAGGFIMWGVPKFLYGFYGIQGSVLGGMPIFSWYYAIAAFWIIVFICLLAILVIDMRHYIIPNELNIVLLILGIFIVVVYSYAHSELPLFRDSFVKQYALLFSPITNVYLSHVLGSFAGVIFFGALSFLSGGRAMGFGDVKLAAGAGLILGWPDMGLAMLLSFIVGGFTGALFMLLKKKGLKDKLPFAPFFVAGFTLTVFAGAFLVENYFRLFQLL